METEEDMLSVVRWLKFVRTLIGVVIWFLVAIIGVLMYLDWQTL